MVEYSFNNKESFITIRKNYNLILHKTDKGILIYKKEKNGEEKDYEKNSVNLISSIATIEGVSNQISNTRLCKRIFTNKKV